MSERVPQPVDVIPLSFRQLLRRLAVWIRPNLWMVFLSLGMVTLPAALAGLYHTVRACLLDPGDSRTVLREEFKQGFFSRFGHSLALGITNLLVLAVIVFSVLFWTRQEERIYNYISIISFYFLAMWWLCQPFLYPAMIENPALKIPKLIGHVLGIVIRRPFQALVITLVNTLLTVLGAVLLGPILLVIPSLVALISIQAYWVLTGRDVPDWIDPVYYETKLQEQENQGLRKNRQSSSQRRKNEF